MICFVVDVNPSIPQRKRPKSLGDCKLDKMYSLVSALSITCYVFMFPIKWLVIIHMYMFRTSISVL